MKIDSELKSFTEKYDRSAMESIDKLSKEYGLVIHKSTIPVFSLKEGFDTFAEYLKGYASYKMENVNSNEASSREEIHESVDNFIKTQLFKEKHIMYSELPEFVQNYVEGVNMLLETVDEVKSSMMEAGIDHESIGDINEFVDKFMDRFHESFDDTMDRILWATGYNSNRVLSGKVKKDPAPVFL